MTEPSGNAALIEPPFYRGEKGEWDAEDCDRIVDGGGACDACDELAVYLVEWQQVARDNGTVPVSGACERHALDVDRRQVVRIATHPSQEMAGADDA